MRTLIATAAIVALASPAFADRCLDMKDADRTHFTSDRVMTVTTKDRRFYTVTFRKGCVVQKYPLTHFVYEQWTLECVKRGDVFPTNSHGPCFVESIQQSAS